MLQNTLDMATERRLCCSAQHSEYDFWSSTAGQESQDRAEAKQVQQVQGLFFTSGSRPVDIEMENAHLRRKLSTVEKEKTSLMLENGELITELEFLHLDLANSKTKIHVLETTIGSKTSTETLMKFLEELRSLEAEVEALRLTHSHLDMKLKDTQEALTAKNEVVEQLKEDLKALKAELEQTNQNTSDLQKDSAHTQTVSTEGNAVQSELQDELQQNTDLELRLSEKNLETSEVEALRKENVDLHLHGIIQEQQLEERSRQVEECQAELASLEAILNLLHLQDDGGGVLCAMPCFPAPVPAGSVPNLKPGQQYQQLLPAFHVLEQDRARLGEQLDQVQEQNSSLQSSLCQKGLKVLQLSIELQQSTSSLSQRDRELKKMSTRLDELEKQLEEKNSDYTLTVEENQALEKSLLEHLKSALDEKMRDYQEAVEESQRDHALTCKELEDQIQLLRVSLGQTQSQIEELEEDLFAVEQEKQDTQIRAESLQTSLTQLTQEVEDNNKNNQETLRNMTAQASQFATQVKFLESALSSCQEKLSSCQKQMEEAEGTHEDQLEAKNREIETLQVEVRSIALACESSNEQKFQLQYGLQRQQTLLQETTTRISELEESQEVLIKQVTHLESQLENEKVSASSELKKMEQRALEANEEAQKHQRQAVELCSSVTQLQEDMNKIRGELSDRERELLLIRRASGAKASQLAHMEKMLQETKGMMDKKSEMVSELEEKVQRSKRDRRNSLHRTQLLESQMKTVRGELVNTLDHLQALRDKLHRSQQKAEERQAAMEKLTAELRAELDHMRREVEDKDETLKESDVKRQRATDELIHRDAVVQDYKADMEQKLATLQEALERSTRDVTESTKQIECLTERLEVVQVQLQEKENLEQDAIEQAQQLRLCQAELQDVSEVLQEMRSHCESLTLQLQDSVRFGKEKESELRRVEEEMEKTLEKTAQEESRLKNAVSTLAQELHTLKKQHQSELCAMQESHADVLKASDCVTSTLRCSQLHLSEELQHTRAHLDQVNQKSASLLAQLHMHEQLLQHTSEALLMTEAEVARLKTRLSIIERSRPQQGITQSSDSRYIHLKSPQANTEETQGSVHEQDQSDESILITADSVRNNTQSPLTHQSQTSPSPTICLRSTLTEPSSELSLNSSSSQGCTTCT